MDKLTGQIEPGKEPVAVTNNRSENEIEEGSNLDGDPLSAEQKTALKLVGMPELDSPGFWQWVKHPTPTNIPQPEALAWAVHQFFLRDQPEKAGETFAVLYNLFKTEAETLAFKNKYVNSTLSNRVKMSEDVVNRTWFALYNKHLSNKKRPFSLFNFRAYFSKVLNSMARDLAIELGYIARVSVSAAENNKNRPDAQDEARQKSRIIKNTHQQSLDEALDTDGGDGGEGINLLSLLADPQSTADFDEIEKAEVYRDFIQRLTPEETEILNLRVEGFNKSEIARKLKKDWQTIDRRIKSIQDKAIEVFGGVRRENSEKRRKVGRPARNQ